MNIKIEKLLSIFLWIVSFHSFAVGVGLIVIPASALQYFGFFPATDRFFLSQGGVFHIAMSICYAMAAYKKQFFRTLIIFSIIVKIIATLFLVIYFTFVSSKLLILFSAVSDLLMGVIIWVLYRMLCREPYFKENIHE